jgi:poly(3-hydroxybutyrate) depolymerase
MRVASITSRLLLVAPLGLFFGCSSGTSGTPGSGTGGSSTTGSSSTATGGSVSSGGVNSSGGTTASGGVASGGTTASTTVITTGGTTASTTVSTTGGTTGTKTGGTTSATTGGTTGSATGGTTAATTGGTTGNATGGTTVTRTGGTTVTRTGGTTAPTGGTTGTTSGTTAAAGSGGGYLPKNDPVPSAGCGKALPSAYKAGASTTRKDMTSASLSREYIIYIPTGYDSSKPYKLLFAWHCMGSSDTGAVNSGYYGAKQNDTGNTTIMVAPQGYTDSMPWRSDDKDVTFFDDMLKLFKSDLCIDTSRVFSIGFSFGGMMTYSLSVARQKDIRAGVGIAAANYNIYVTNSKTHAPIGWMQTTGVSDTTCPWGAGSNRGAEAIAIEHGTDNGCTVPNPVPKWTSGNHLCVDFAGCKDGYPTKVCTFNGGHTDTANEGGGNWIYSEAWKFFTSF